MSRGCAFRVFPHGIDIHNSLTGLASGRGDIRSLEEDLEGYYRLRVGKYRVVFRHDDDGKVYCVFIETRALVYQLFSSAKALLDPPFTP